MKFLLFLFFPAFVFASFNDYYVQSFADHFREERFNESLEILENWEISQPSNRNRILGMRAAVFLAKGNPQKSRILMDECVENLEIEEISDPLLGGIIKMYYEALENDSENFLAPIAYSQLCKQEQPKGIKLKYWIGVGQIVAGVLAAPFSAGTSISLVVSGTTMVVDAASDALDNKENWESDLNRRQRINPDLQKKSSSASAKMLLI